MRLEADTYTHSIGCNYYRLKLRHTTTQIHRESHDNLWTFRRIENQKKECINLASYNYLGFAESSGPPTESAIEAVRQKGLAYCSPTGEMGATKMHKELDATVANFLGTEDAVTFGMGFATNSMNLPRLVSKGCLVLSKRSSYTTVSTKCALFR